MLLFKSMENTDEDKLILQICENKSSGQKIIHVPRKSRLVAGDYVKVIKID